MSRLVQFAAFVAFVALLHFTDRVIAGAVQCAAAGTCPKEARP